MSRTLVVLAAWLFVAAASTLFIEGQEASKPYPVFTDSHLEATMKTVGPNFAGANGLLQNQEHEDAKAQFIRTREQLATTITFWRDRQREDAVGFLRNALRALDELDDALSSGQIEQDSISGIVGRIGSACQACHGVYREEDPDTGEFRVKTSALSG